MRAVATDGLLTATHLNSEPINAGLTIAISKTQRRENDGVYRISGVLSDLRGGRNA